MGFNSLKTSKIIPIIFLLIFFIPPTHASLIPEDFITPDELYRDMDSTEYEDALTQKLSEMVMVIGGNLEDVIDELHKYAKSKIERDKHGKVEYYSKEYVAVLQIIRDLDKAKLVLLSCYTNATQLRFFDPAYMNRMYATNLGLFNGYYYSTLRISAMNIGSNLEFVNNKDIKDKTIDALGGVEELFNTYFEYMQFITK